MQATGLSGIAKSQISKLCKDIDDRVNGLVDRPLDGEWPCLSLYATYLKVRDGGRIVSVAAITRFSATLTDVASDMSTNSPAQREQQHGTPLHLRVFLSSPGDVAEERALARQVIERLQYESGLRGRVFLETVAWDKPGAETPMLATKAPQEAINEELPRPAECDIVIVILWSRIGTPLPEKLEKPDGSRYLSGTKWEYWNAVRAAEQHDRPEVLVYRRTEVPAVAMNDPEKVEKERQWQLVSEFFESFTSLDGSIARAINSYATPDAFERLLERHLRNWIHHLLEPSKSAAELTRKPRLATLPLWKGSPFPGLRAETSPETPAGHGRAFRW